MKNEEIPVVSFRNVTKKYKGVTALSDISFDLFPGEIMGYIGPNGAGKTTSMKILVGLMKDFTGEVYVNGENVLHSALAPKYLGYMPQDTGFQTWRTAEHALTTLGLLSGMDKNTLEKKIYEILKRVGLADVADRKIVHFSGGMQQKLKLAQALLHDPRLVILDEPMNGLDPASRYQMKQIIKDLAESGKTVIFSSHILSDVSDIAHRITVIAKGQLIRTGTPQQLQEEFKIGDDIEIIVAPGVQEINEIASLQGIVSVEKAGTERYLIHLTAGFDPDAALQSVYATISSGGLKVRTVRLVRPGLEEVYLKLTGGQEK